MISLLASITGFIGSIAPDIIKFLFEKHSKDHNLSMLDHKLKLHDRGVDIKLEEMQRLAEVSEKRSLYSTYKVGIKWVDALNATVRPVLAYSFFALYVFSKIMQYNSLIISDAVIDNIMMLWGEEDQAIFAGIISFYYGQRAISKIRKY